MKIIYQELIRKKVKIIEDLFKNLEILEEWWKKGFIDGIDNYFRMKSQIVDFYRNLSQENQANGDLPF